jgi:hypothetical protein
MASLTSNANTAAPFVLSSVTNVTLREFAIDGCVRSGTSCIGNTNTFVRCASRLRLERVALGMAVEPGAFSATLPAVSGAVNGEQPGDAVGDRAGDRRARRSC